MEVALILQNAAGEQGTVQATGDTYDAALAAARALIPEGCKAIVIRTDT